MRNSFGPYFLCSLLLGAAQVAYGGLISRPSYIFNRTSTKNVAVYFGQSPVTSSTSLAAQCADPSIDIVILAFVIDQLHGGLYPSVNFGAACGGQTALMASSAPGLLSCPALAADILTCQKTYGRKVLLSVGGATSTIAFASDQQASTFANVLWKIFGPPGQVDVGLRPFGTVEVDGFDIDNEDQRPAYFPTLGASLRTLFTTASKVYYLSSSPQCPFPDASNPLPLLLLCDFVFVQFYNNPSCEIGSSAFVNSILTWSAALQNSKLATKTRLYIGTPGWSAAGPTAYASLGGAQGIAGVVQTAAHLGLQNLGGAMFWDGPEGRANIMNGQSIVSWAKQGLSS